MQSVYLKKNCLCAEKKVNFVVEAIIFLFLLLELVKAVPVQKAVVVGVATVKIKPPLPVFQLLLKSLIVIKHKNSSSLNRAIQKKIRKFLKVLIHHSLRHCQMNWDQKLLQNIWGMTLCLTFYLVSLIHWLVGIMVFIVT